MACKDQNQMEQPQQQAAPELAQQQPAPARPSQRVPPPPPLPKPLATPTRAQRTQPPANTPPRLSQTMPRMQQTGGYPMPPRGCAQLGGESDPANFNDDDSLEELAPATAPSSEPEPETSSEGSLSVTTRIEYSALPIGQNQDVFGLVTVQAAAAPAPKTGEAERQ